MPIPRIQGIEFNFGGEILVIPPLSLGSLEALQDRVSQLGQVSDLSPAAISTVVDAAHAALRRNYPEITREKVADLIDVGNMAEVMQAVMDISGAMRKAADAGKAGAAPAATT